MLARLVNISVSLLKKPGGCFPRTVGGFLIRCHFVERIRDRRNFAGVGRCWRSRFAVRVACGTGHCHSFGDCFVFLSTDCACLSAWRWFVHRFEREPGNASGLDCRGGFVNRLRAHGSGVDFCRHGGNYLSASRIVCLASRDFSGVCYFHDTG